MPKKTKHTGIIVDNQDPELRGRLTVECPTIVSGDVMDWTEPKFFFIDSSQTAGAFFIPSIGSNVEVEIEDEEDSQTSGLEAKWSCAVYPFGSVPEEFKTNYPERRGWKTAAGHIFYFDDTSDDMVFQYTHPSGTEIKVDNSGNITLGAGSGKSVSIGSGADQYIARGDILKTILDDIISTFNGTIPTGHTHTCPPGGGTTTAMTNFITETTTNLLSDDHKVK